MAQSSQEIRILHITPWFPGPSDPTNAIFIRRHIEALAPHVTQFILHIDLRQDFDNEEHTPKRTSIWSHLVHPSWRYYEWRFSRILRRELKKLDAARNFTHVNFHIAYPALVYFNKIRPLLPSRMIVTEHWSAYYYNFFSTSRPHRLASLFRHEIPLITVSRKLAGDIEKFAGREIRSVVVPNVVDEKFRYKGLEVKGHYFTSAFWKTPKAPFSLLEAISSLQKKGIIISLRIGGNGPLWNQMQQYVSDNNLSEQVVFLHQTTAEILCEELNIAKAFILPTGYETFSVVCAEALVCGCPVIADRVGALPELVDSSNGILRETESWEELLQNFDGTQFNRKQIADRAYKKYNSEEIGRLYMEQLRALK